MKFFVKSRVIKSISVFLCLTLVLYSAGFPAVQYYSYASETCDPEDEDYQECVAEEERERLEEEQERLKKEAKEKAEFEENLYEDYVEENEDISGWKPVSKEEFLNQYYNSLTPTASPSDNSSSSNLESQNFENANVISNVTPTPTATAENSQTGEASANKATENTVSQIDVQNINTTTLEQELNVTANTGDNTICQKCSPKSTNINNEEAINKEEGDLVEPILTPIESAQGNLNGGKIDSSDSDVGNYSIQHQQASGSEDQEVYPQGEGFSQSEEEKSHYEFSEDQREDDFATDASGENFSSGEDANQMAVSEDIDQFAVSNENELELLNDMDVSSASGKNELSQNEGNADLETGAGESSATMQNYGNINVTDGGDQKSAEAVINEETGNDSVNFTSDEVSDTIKVENTNQAAVENNLSVSSISGENELSENEGEATLTTGEVEIIANLLNILNLNITGKDFTHLIVNIFGNLTGEFDLDDIAESYLGMDEDDLVAIAKNTATGENSENTGIAKNSETLDVNNKNEAAVINNVDVQGVTGKNELSGNEDPVNLVTGRIKILTSILNFINANFSGTDWYFAMINIFGSLTGDILLPDPDQFLFAQDGGVEAGNSETGDDSQNQALASETEKINVTNDNSAEVKNTINVTGDSGTNQALGNEDKTEMETGNVDVAANIMNWLDYNIFGNRWVMVVVNIFGRWLGRVIAFPGQGDIDAPESGTLVAVAGGEGDLGPAVQAGNEETGDDSDNFAESSSETSWDVSNENKAYVENNVDVQGVSGQNQTNENEDPVKTTTGWIDLDVNLLNLINFNVTGRQWMLLIVNIFGDFFGDIVFPHEEPEAVPQVLAENSSSDADEFGFQADQAPVEGGETAINNGENLSDSQSFGGEKILGGLNPSSSNGSDTDKSLGSEGTKGSQETSSNQENLGDKKTSTSNHIDDSDEDSDQVYDLGSNSSSDEIVILNREESFVNQDKLITKSLRSFVFTGLKNQSESLVDEKGLDIWDGNGYNLSLDDESLSYNETEQGYQERDNFLMLFLKIISIFTALFKKFLARII